MDPIETLRNRRLEAHKAAETIVALAEAEKRDLTDAEQGEIDNHLAEVDRLGKEIDKREKITANAEFLNGSAGRRAPAQNPNPTVPAEPRDPVLSGRNGFRNFGEFAQAVKSAGTPGGAVDKRLTNATASTYASEGVGADGGFAVPPDFRANIVKAVDAEKELLSQTDRQFSSSNTFVVPADETTPWGTGGVKAYWDNEAEAATQSKPSLKEAQIKLHKLTSLVVVTEELLSDAPSLENYLLSKIADRMTSKINEAIINGTGVGQPLGILKSPCLVSVAKESSQAADSIDAKNIFKMWSRMYAPLRSRAVWLINQDIEPQLFGMTVAVKNVAGSENVGGSVVYLPANGLSDSPYGTLMGRPVIPQEACSTLGDKGDIIFAALPGYLTVAKSSGPQTATSIHLFFDQGLSAFRVIYRLGGQPWLTAPISPKNGSATRSSFVTLDDRA